MQQQGIVSELHGASAVVRIARTTACGSMCMSCGLCKAQKELFVTAENAACAQVGDLVEVDAATGRVLGSAFLVYGLPLALFFFGYGIAGALGASETLRSWCGVGAFFVSFVVLWRLFGRRGKREIPLCITRVLQENPNRGN